MLTNANVNLSCRDLVGNLVDGGQARGALSVDSVERGGVWDACSEGSHASSRGSSTSRKDVSYDDILDKSGVDAGLGVGSLEDGREDFFGTGVLETAFLALENCECTRMISATSDAPL